MKRRTSLLWRIILALLCLALAFGLTSPIIQLGESTASSKPNSAEPKETEEAELSFTDVAETDYFYEPVRWAVANSITDGTSDTTFSPKDACTRGQVVTFLWKAMGSPEPGKKDNPFADVENDAYYADAVLWATEEGITSGTTETTFSPEEPCNRAQVVTFLWAAAAKPTPVKTTTGFTDVTETDYYLDPVLWAFENGVTEGATDTRFGAGDVCTRAQVMTFLWKAMGM